MSETAIVWKKDSRFFLDRQLPWLDRYLFDNPRRFQELLVWWRQEYNRRRPHSSLDYLTPEEFAEQATSAEMLLNSARMETIVTLTLSS